VAEAFPGDSFCDWKYAVKDPARLTACPFVDCEPGPPAKRGFDGTGVLASHASPRLLLETTGWRLGHGGSR